MEINIKRVILWLLEFIPISEKEQQQQLEMFFNCLSKTQKNRMYPLSGQFDCLFLIIYGAHMMKY